MSSRSYFNKIDKWEKTDVKTNERKQNRQLLSHERRKLVQKEREKHTKNSKHMPT